MLPNRLSVDKYLALTRRFASAYSKYKDDPHVKKLFDDLKVYGASLKSLGLKVRVDRIFSLSPLFLSSM